jgi:NlpC/P60 family
MTCSKPAVKTALASAFRLRNARSLVLVACLLLAGAAHAANNVDDGTPLLRAEKSLRDFGSKAKDTASDITSYALSLIGVDYKFGGNTPDQGLDCSGLIRYVFQQATGLSLPRSARDQARLGESVSLDKLQPGDLVFFNTRRFQFSHVGLYIGDNRFVHAPSRGGAVQVVSLDNEYWKKAFNGARRIVGGLPDISALVPSAIAATPKLDSPTSAPALHSPSESAGTPAARISPNFQ